MGWALPQDPASTSGPRVKAWSLRPRSPPPRCLGTRRTGRKGATCLPVMAVSVRARAAAQGVHPCPTCARAHMGGDLSALTLAHPSMDWCPLEGGPPCASRCVHAVRLRAGSPCVGSPWDGLACAGRVTRAGLSHLCCAPSCFSRCPSPIFFFLPHFMPTSQASTVATLVAVVTLVASTTTAS